MNVIENIKIIVTTLNRLDDYKEGLSKKLSEYDLRLSDLYHYVENNKLNTKECYRMNRELKRVLTERRKIKEDISLLSKFEIYKNRLNNTENRNILLSSMNQKEKQVKKYTYEIYTEQEIKELLGSV